MIAIKCPSCSYEFDVDDQFAGRSGKCKRCGESIRVPSASFGGMEFDDVPPPSSKNNQKSKPQIVYLKAEKGAGTTGNVLAAIVSLFIPGAGQLVQGRLLIAIIMFVLAVALWVGTAGLLGWIINLWSVIDAAIWKPKD